MKAIAKALLFMALTGSFLRSPAQGSVSNSVDQATGFKHLFIDVHRLTPGKVKLKDVAQAHAAAPGPPERAAQGFAEPRGW